MAFDPLRALLVQLALAGLAALLSRSAKPLAIALGIVIAVVVPWTAGPIPLLRGLSTLIGFIGLLRIIDVVRTRESWSATRRVAHVMSFVDSRTLKRAPRRIDVRALGHTLLWAVLAALGVWVARLPHLAARWAGGVVLAYGIIEVGYAITTANYRALGFVTPPLHVHPIASLSVGELWGKRWATPVSTWLRENCYRPLARRGHPRLGLLFGFVASGVGHAVPALVALGWRMALSMLGFFVVQGLAVVVEARLGTARWPRAARRAWTVAVMLAAAPLFVEPALQVLGWPPL